MVAQRDSRLLDAHSLLAEMGELYVKLDPDTGIIRPMPGVNAVEATDAVEAGRGADGKNYM